MRWQDATNTLLKTLVSKPRLGVITDFDGTLSPIVDDPADAKITPRNHALLTALAPQLALLAVVSGRGAADVHRLADISGAVYVGNHGMERWRNGDVIVPEHVSAYRPNLEQVLADLNDNLLAGMHIEDKGATASIHYRRTENPAQAQAHMQPILVSIARKHDIELHAGKMVFELRPPIDMNKGTTFANLIDEFNLDGAIYLGDDVTDADALKRAGELRKAGVCYALGIGIQHTDDTPQAILDYSDLLATDVDDTADLFGWLLNALSASST